jgi:hypothetical protein
LSSKNVTCTHFRFVNCLCSHWWRLRAMSHQASHFSSQLPD